MAKGNPKIYAPKWTITSTERYKREQEEKKREAAKPSSSSSKSNSSGKNQKQGGSTAANQLHSDVNLTYPVKKQPTRSLSTVRSSSDRLASLNVPKTRLQIAALQQQRDREKAELEKWKSKRINTIDSSADLPSRRGTQGEKIWKGRRNLLEESIWRLDSRIAQLQRDVYESSAYRNDFDQYSSVGERVKNPSLLTANLQREAYLSGRRPKDAALGNEVTFAENNFDKKLSEELFSLNLAGDKSYQYLTDNERQVYNYVLAKEGRQAAGNYLDLLQEELNQRRGTTTGKQVRSIENSFLRTAATGGYAAKSGLENFNSGIKGLKPYFSGAGNPLPTSSVLYASDYIRNDLGPVGGFFYDATQTIANMAPAMAAGAASAVSGIGSVVLGASAAGNAYNQALKEGYSPAEARRYASLIGISEGAMQYGLGGVSKLGGKMTQNIAQRTIRNIDNSLLRVAADLGIKMTGEGTEEYLQSVLEPAYRNLAFDENNEIRLVSKDAAYSFLLGAVTAGLLEGGAVVSDERSMKRLGAAVERSGHYGELLEQAQAMEKTTESYQLSSQLSAGSTRATENNIGRLLTTYVKEGGDLDFMKQPVGMEADLSTEDAPVNNADLFNNARNIPTADLETLSTAAQSSSNTNEAVQNRIQENIRRGRREAAVLGENGSRAFAKAYDANAAAQLQPEDAVQGFAQIYNAALQGKSLDSITTGKAALLPDYMRVAAEGAGKQDAIRASQAKYFGKDAGLVRDETYRKAKLTRKNDRILDAIGKAAGVQIRFAEQVEEGRANAKYDPNTGVLTIALDASDPVRVAFTHEIIHRIRHVSPEAYSALAKFVQDRLSSSEMAFLKNSYQEVYKNSDTGYLTEEIVADAFGYLMGEGAVLEEFVKANRTTAQRILDAIVDFIDSVKQVLKGKNGVQLSPEQKEAFASLQKDMEAMAKTLTTALNKTAKVVQNNEKAGQSRQKNTAQQGGEVRYSINRDFQTNILEWYQEGQPKGDRFILGSTGPVLQGLGAIESDIYMNGEKISAILEQHPEMSIREIQRIPEILDDPVLVLKSRNKVRSQYGNSRLVMFGTVRATDGRPVLCVLDLRPVKNNLLIDDMHKVNSAYTKDNDPMGFVSGSEILYADKNRTISLLHGMGFQMPMSLLRSGSVGSITYSEQSVKLEGLPFSTVIQVKNKKSNAAIAKNPSPGTNRNTASRKDGGAKLSMKEKNPYKGKSLTADSVIYSYDFLTALPDMQVTVLPEVSAVRDAGGKVDTRKAVTAGMRNARNAGAERDGKVFVRNGYTGKQLLVTTSSIRHGLNGGMNRLLTNARLGAVIGDVVKNAVPINALQNKAKGVTGTYAMAAYAADSQGREFVAIVTVEQYDGNISGVEVYDVTHAVSGRQKNASRADTKSQGFYPSTTGTISIEDFLGVVNMTHQSILSEDVLAHLGETRDPNGFYTEQVRFSLKAPVEQTDSSRVKQVNSVEGARFSLKEPTAGTRWTIENNILDKKDWAVFYRQIADFNKRGYTLPETKNGEYIVEVGNKLIFTDGDYDAPVITEVIILHDDNETNMSLAKEWIFDEEARFGRHDEAKRSIEIFYRQAYGSYYRKSDYSTDGKLLERREGADRTADSSGAESGGRGGSGQERRSLKETSTLLREIAAVNRQKALLEERLAYWKGQTKRTEKISTNPKEVREAAKKLAAAYQADLDLNEFAANLQDFYDYIANNGNGKENLTGEDVWQRAQEVARNLVESAVVSNSEISREYQDLLNHLKTTKIQLSPGDIKQIPDYKRLRKQALKGLRLSQAPYSNVDEVFQELSFLWPEFFDSEKIRGPESQLKRMAEVLDSLSGTKTSNPFSGYAEEAVAGTANEILELFFDLPQTKPTFADRQAQKLAAAKAEGRSKAQKLRLQNKEQLQKLREQNRQQVQKAIEKERLKRENQLETLKNRYAERNAAGRERRNARELRDRIMRHTKALSQKLLRPSDKKHIPDPLHTAVAAMLEAINLESVYTVDPATGKRRKGGDGDPTKRTEAFRQLREQYLKIVGNENAQMVVDPSLLGNAAEGAQGNFDKVLAMRDKPIMAMTSAELQTVWDVIKAVEHSISTAGQNFSASPVRYYGCLGKSAGRRYRYPKSQKNLNCEKRFA